MNLSPVSTCKDETQNNVIATRPAVTASLRSEFQGFDFSAQPTAEIMSGINEPPRGSQRLPAEDKSHRVNPADAPTLKDDWMTATAGHPRAETVCCNDDFVSLSLL